MIKQIYEHLITKKKYNTLMLKYEVKKDELEKKIVELNTEKRIRKIEKDKFEEVIKDYMNQLQKSKEEINKLKKKNKEKKNEK